MFRELSDTIGAADDYDFYSADEYVSTDPARPTIFQNLYEKRTEPGHVAKLAGFPAVPLPFGFNLKAYTQAVGYVAEGVFRGTMQLDYDLRVIGLAPMYRQMLEARIGKIPETSDFRRQGNLRGQVILIILDAIQCWKILGAIILICSCFLKRSSTPDTYSFACTPPIRREAPQ